MSKAAEAVKPEAETEIAKDAAKAAPAKIEAKTETKKTANKKGEAAAKPEGAHKLAIIKKFARGKGDTGSPEVQIAVLTDRINYLTKHFEQHKKDHHSRRGLLMLVGNRRRLLNYIKSTNATTYEKLLSELGLRK